MAEYENYEETFGYEEDEAEITKEEKNRVIRMNEKEMLANLMAATTEPEDKVETANIEIVREGKKIIEFRIHPLTEKEYAAARKKHTKYKKNKQLNTKVAESVDASKFHAQLVYDATVTEDRELLWHYKPAWEAIGVLNPVDFIEVFLRAGETNRIMEELDRLSGYEMDEDELSKN